MTRYQDDFMMQSMENGNRQLKSQQISLKQEVLLI